MPFKSESQRRKFYAMLERGEISQETFDKWEKETKGKLPEKTAAVFDAFADELELLQATKTAQPSDPISVMQGLYDGWSPKTEEGDIYKKQLGQAIKTLTGTD